MFDVFRLDTDSVIARTADPVRWIGSDSDYYGYRPTSTPPISLHKAYAHTYGPQGEQRWRYCPRVILRGQANLPRPVSVD